METAAIDLLDRLVAIPSPSRQEHRAASFLADWLAGQGLAGFLQKPFKMATLRTTLQSVLK